MQAELFESVGMAFNREDLRMLLDSLIVRERQFLSKDEGTYGYALQSLRERIVDALNDLETGGTL